MAPKRFFRCFAENSFLAISMKGSGGASIRKAGDGDLGVLRRKVAWHEDWKRGWLPHPVVRLVLKKLPRWNPNIRNSFLFAV